MGKPQLVHHLNRVHLFVHEKTPAGTSFKQGALFCFMGKPQLVPHHLNRVHFFVHGGEKTACTSFKQGALLCFMGKPQLVPNHFRPDITALVDWA